ncbi:hypothetical protein D3C83_30180 [compost metagenome]
MDAVVVAEGEPLQLLEKREPQLVAEILADGFREIVVGEGEEAAHDSDAQHQQGRGDERRLRLRDRRAA